MMDAILIKALETEEEIRGKAYVHWKSWQEAYAGIVDQAFLDGLSQKRYEESSARWKDCTLIAKDGEKVIGLVVCGPCRDEDMKEAGEIYAIYILSEYYGKKVGYRLMLAALERLKNYSKIVVWVLAANARAIRFYQRCGFQFDGTQKELLLGKPVTEARMTLCR